MFCAEASKRWAAAAMPYVAADAAGVIITVVIGGRCRSLSF